MYVCMYTSGLKCRYYTIILKWTFSSCPTIAALSVLLGIKLCQLSSY